MIKGILMARLRHITRLAFDTPIVSLQQVRHHNQFLGTANCLQFYVRVPRIGGNLPLP
jgi:hypothetical protein